MKKLLTVLISILIGSIAMAQSKGTRVKVTMNDKVVYATINNTETAKGFLKLLPFHVDGYRSTSDICCAVSEKLPNNPKEDTAWKIGEIGWFRGWFTILCADEEQFLSPRYSIIGKFDEKDIKTVTSLKGNIKITVEEAK